MLNKIKIKFIGGKIHSDRDSVRGEGKFSVAARMAFETMVNR
jgi:hypothetical protein